ncbi:MFS transporter [Curtobacterium sp. MCBD17_013]|uniref:MFS transporter n=1 Tax=Curtobacterium sp. MCBD17_013 TaxID=2175668 RepID=UPI000DA9D6E3|nr:MFS transporter [Curtobacterium sp. MCBD17_013]PZF63020.1 MFS transporter [Curtobacterium sp. MCBD17_013]
MTEPGRTTGAAEPATVWRNAPFLRLWSGESASAVGSELAVLAIPTLAVTVLAASTFEIGVLTALETVAFLVIGLPAGAWVDRMRKRRVMLAADLTRALLLATIPVAWLLGALTIWQLMVVAALVGAATVFFDVAYQSYPPMILPSALLGDANGKLEASQQVARVGGPAASGALLAALRPALVVGIDALSYLASFVALLGIRDDEQPRPEHERLPLVTEIREGLAFVFHQPLLVRVVLCTAGLNLFSGIGGTVLPLLVLRDLHLGTLVWGAATSVGAVGGLLGALAAGRVARRVGEGTAIPVAAVAAGVGALLLATPGLVPTLAVPLLVLAEFLTSAGVLVYNITQVTYRQRICPPRLLGRMNASIRFVVWGVVPIGGIAAGLLGTWLGVEATMWVAGIGALLAALPVLLSPLLGMRELPAEPAAA